MKFVNIMNFWKLQIGDTLWSAKITEDYKLQLIQWKIWDIKEEDDRKTFIIAPSTSTGIFRELEIYKYDYFTSFQIPKKDNPKNFMAYSYDPAFKGDIYEAKFYWDLEKLKRSMKEICCIELKKVKNAISDLISKQRSLECIKTGL